MYLLRKFSINTSAKTHSFVQFSLQNGMQTRHKHFILRWDDCFSIDCTGLFLGLLNEPLEVLKHHSDWWFHSFSVLYSNRTLCTARCDVI